VNSRLALLPPASLDDAQVTLYDVIARGRRSGGESQFLLTNEDGSLTGPFNAMLYAPQLGHALQAVGEVIRFESSIPRRGRELAILTVASHWCSDFEWYAHEAAARGLGVADTVLIALLDGVPPPLDDPIDAAIHDYCVALLRRESIDEQRYRQTVAVLGESTMVELTVLVGYYTTLAMLLEVFQVGVPEGPSPFADDRRTRRVEG
jgi:4-carboxymuconolactone decarboxylase